jgi:hypothetical protein
MMMNEVKEWEHAAWGDHVLWGRDVISGVDIFV